MFNKKYIFETKNTKSKRYIRNIFIIPFACYVVYLVGCLFLIQSSIKHSEIAKSAFYKTTPDLLTVFTGDNGRIPFTLQLAKKYDQSNILITGVYSRTTVNTILKNSNTQVNHLRLDIDYWAQNTVENVISTIRYLRKRIGIKNVLVISHDYHIGRIKLIFEHLISRNDRYKLYFIGIKTNYKDFNNIKKLHKELFKFFRAFVFLIFWNQDISL